MKNKIFITGSNGFVGRHLVKQLITRNMPFIAGNRLLYGDLTTQDFKETILDEVEILVHLAARVHVMDEHDSASIFKFRQTNVLATIKLANAAKEKGVKRFIYLSSVKVNGESTTGIPFSADDKPAPEDPYGISKMEAEKALLALHVPNVFEVVIIRPPLIYGIGVAANFQKLFFLVQKGIPTPFGLVQNKRSFVSVLNLVDLIIKCFDHPMAAGQIFLVSDDNDLSIRDLINQMGLVLDKNPAFLPVPVFLMKAVAKLIVKKSYADRLLGDLQVDISKTKKLLQWSPSFSFKETFSRGE